MREIKFRAWNKKTKKMYEVRDLIMTPSGQVWVDAINEYKDDKFDKANRNLEWGYDVSVELMQFVGLLDKNGKEIYEGDIVTDGFNERLEGVVKYQAPEFIIQLPRRKTWSAFIKNPNENQFQEVIGNIYENPELLSEKKRGD